MKKLKSILIVVSCFSLVLGGVLLPVSAEENSVEYLISQDEFEMNKKLAFENIVKKYESGITTFSSTDYTYKYDPIETKISGLSSYKVCFGQPQGGTKFSSKGLGFYWADSSSKAGTFNMSIAFTKGPVTVGLNFVPGTTKTSKTSYFTAISDKQVGKYVKLHCARKYSVTHYRVYRKIRTASTWTHIGDEYPSTPYSQAFQVKVV